MDEEDSKHLVLPASVWIGIVVAVYNLTLSYMRVKGLFYLLVGITWMFITSPSRLAGIEWMDHVITADVIGIVWVSAGALGIATSFTDHRGIQRLGWAALIATPIAIGAYFFISWIIYFIPGFSVEGYERANVTTISYWAYGASAFIMSLINTLTSGASVARHAVQERGN